MEASPDVPVPDPSPPVAFLPPRRLPVETTAKYNKLVKQLTEDEEQPNPPTRFFRMRLSDIKVKGDYFLDIVDFKKGMLTEVIDLWMLEMRRRLIQRISVLPTVNAANTIILDTDFFVYLSSEMERIEAETKKMFKEKEAVQRQGDGPIGSWLPNLKWVGVIKGMDVGNTQRPWWDAEQVIVPCYIPGHYVVCRVNLGTYKCVMYDPVYHRISDTVRASRSHQLRGLLTLLPRLLELAHWHARTSIDYSESAGKSRLELVVAPDSEQFHQRGSFDCGAYICMHVERFISGAPSIDWGNKKTAFYRRLTAATLFEDADPVDPSGG